MSTTVIIRGGQRLVGVHHAGTCRGDRCPIHKVSAHHMRQWPQNWRGDRYLMERICPHGVGHPDPDDMFAGDGVHGCDGCCTTPPPAGSFTEHEATCDVVLGVHVTPHRRCILR